MEADVSMVTMSLSVDLVLSLGALEAALRWWKKDLLLGNSETNKPHNSTAGRTVALQWSWSHLIFIHLNFLKHTFAGTHMHTCEWMSLPTHAWRIYLCCAERHIIHSWFLRNPTDLPLVRGMPWHSKQALWIGRASVIVVRGRGKRQLVQQAFNWLIVSLRLPVIIKMTQPPRLQSHWWHCKGSSGAVIACPSAETIVLARELKAFVLKAEKSGVQPGRFLAMRPGKWVI